MRARKHAGTGIGLFLLAALMGCAVQQTRHEVPLRYEENAETRPLPPGKRPAAVALSPFQDLRRNKGSLGRYEGSGISADLAPASGSAAGDVTEMVRAHLKKLGIEVQDGDWDGKLDSVPKMRPAFALTGRIRQLGFSARSSYFKALNSGRVVIEFRLGGRDSRRLEKRTITVLPGGKRFQLFGNNADNLSQIDGIIQKAVNEAVRDGLVKVIRSMMP
ncbi:MAG: hypothetical protein V3V62_07370 [bacterium]